MEPKELASFMSKGLRMLSLLGILIVLSLWGCSILVPPTEVENVSASDGQTFGEVEVTWESVDKAETYSILRSTSSEGVYSQIAETQSPLVRDPTVIEGIVYWYKIQACNNAGCGPLSSSDAGFARPTPPPPPSF